MLHKLRRRTLCIFVRNAAPVKHLKMIAANTQPNEYPLFEMSSTISEFINPTQSSKSTQCAWIKIEQIYAN
jgi:hypothetical protein